MSEPFLRIPLSEAEAHKRELASAKARIAVLEAAGGTVTLEDLRLTLIEEADEDTGVIRACLEGDDVDAGDINVVDTILALCAKVRHLSDLLEGAKEVNADLQAKLEKKRPTPPAPAQTTIPDHTPTVATRRDAHGRRFWDGAGWVTSADEAYASATLDVETLRGHVGERDEPRAARLQPALLAEDAAKDAQKNSSAPTTPLVPYPAWEPGARQAHLAKFVEAGTASPGEMREFAEMRGGLRCALCGHGAADTTAVGPDGVYVSVPFAHTPGCAAEVRP